MIFRLVLQGSPNHMLCDAVSYDLDAARNMWFYRVASSCDCTEWRGMWLWFWRGKMSLKWQKYVPKFQGRVVSEKKGPCQEACTTSSGYGSEMTKTHPKIPGACYFWKKKAPARKPAHRRPDFGPQITKTCPKTPGTRYFWKKKAPARKPAHSRHF
jgi:hypothetical protein